MTTIKCLAIDDEYLALKILTDYASRVPFMEMVATSKSALNCIDSLQTNEIDLLLLDIQMPDISGLDFLSTLKNPPLVIITTAYKEYALEGYEYDVIDYLLKPIRFERFLKGVNKAKEQIALRNKELTKPIVAPSTSNDKESDFCYLKSGYKSDKVYYKDIIYVEGQKEYITIHTKGKKYTLLKSLTSMEEELSPYNFIRSHRSYIISLDSVTAFYSNALEIGTIKLPIGRSYKEKVKRSIELSGNK